MWPSHGKRVERTQSFEIASYFSLFLAYLIEFG